MYTIQIMYRAFKCHSDDKVNSSKYFINVQSKQKFYSLFCRSTVANHCYVVDERHTTHIINIVLARQWEGLHD